MTVLQFFDRLELTIIGTAVRDSSWLFPAVESVHLLGLAMLGGAVLLVDLRLLGLGLGVGLQQRTPAYLCAQVNPWLLGALAVIFISGSTMFLSEAVKCYYSPAFWLKVQTLICALLFTFVVRNRVLRRWELVLPWQAKVLGACSLSLWFTVAAAGRWIGFS